MPYHTPKDEQRQHTLFRNALISERQQSWINCRKKLEVLCANTQRSRKIRSTWEQESINDFKLALSLPSHEVSNYLWNYHPIIADWFKKKYFLHKAVYPLHPTISTETAVELFQLALAGKNRMLIKALWEANSTIEEWYTRNTNIRLPNQITSTIFSRDFNLILECDLPEIVLALVNRPDFHRYWSKEGTLSEKEIIKDFRRMLDTPSCAKGASRVWRHHKELLYKFYQEKNNLTESMLLNNLLIDFKKAVINGHNVVARELWCKHSLIPFWFCSYPTFGSMQSESVSLPEALFLFNAALQFKNDSLAVKMLHENKELHTWFNGFNGKPSCNTIDPLELTLYVEKMEQNGNSCTALALKTGNPLYELAKKAPGFEREVTNRARNGSFYVLNSFFAQRNRAERNHEEEIYTIAEGFF